MIDHTGVTVSDFEKSKNFYVESLRPIGYRLLLKFGTAVKGQTNVAGFGEPPKADFWISQGTPNEPRIHIAFRARTRSVVDAFHQAAIAAGGRDHGPPGLRPSIILTITALSFSTPTATTLKSCVTSRNRLGLRGNVATFSPYGRGPT